MKKRHIVVVALLIGIGTALGAFAVTRTSHLGVSSRTSSKKVVDSTVTAQTRRLNALEASLHKALATKPPALPPVPKLKSAPQAATQVIYSAAPAPATRVVVRAPAPRTAAPPASRGGQHHESDDSHSSSGSSGGDTGD